ncbi:hypothetical protein ACIREK_30655 [Streptomyces sp. NPDC102415]|uniref:hypothetical protein n=1 Tax=Streptomyces sp. NPDC102415 TaxID=3366173 RepID=UPI0038016EE6
MNIRIATAATALAVVLAGLTGCGASYDETIAACRKELTERSEGAKGKPAACKDVKDDDYAEIFTVVFAEKEGWLDENGNVDMGEMIEDGSQG